MLVKDRIGVSEPVAPLGIKEDAGSVDGAAQHCASEPLRPDVCRILLPIPSGLGTDRRSSKASVWPDASRSHRFDSYLINHQERQRRPITAANAEA